MADITTIKFLSLTGLTQYDAKIKAFVESKVAEGDAKSFKAVNLVDGKLQFFTEDPITGESVATYSIELPEQDLSHLMTLVDGAVSGDVAVFGENGQVIDGNVKLADLATKDEVNAVQTNIDELAEFVGELPEGTIATSVIEYVNAKTTGIATDAALEELNNQVVGLQTTVQGIADDYLTSEDKTELEGKIALKADQSALDELAEAAATKEALKAEEDRAKGEEARIEGLVTAEAERAAGVEADLDERLEKVEAFFVGAAEDEGEGESLKNALDTLVEIQDYINTDGAAADEMIKDIAANAKAIADHMATDHDFAAADETLKDELTELINAKADDADLTELAGRVKANEDAIALKAAQADLDAEVEAREALAERVVELEKVDHEHANKELLDTYTQTNEDLADAVAKKHAHENADELAKVADGDVAKWNAMEGNAASYTDAEIDKVEAVIGTVAENKTVVEMIADAQAAATYNDEEVKADIAENASAIETLSQTHATDKQALEAKDAEIAGNVTQLQEDVEALQAVVHEEISTEEIENLFK